LGVYSSAGAVLDANFGRIVKKSLYGNAFVSGTAQNLRMTQRLGRKINAAKKTENEYIEFHG
jgi:hypothetical protein